MLQDGDTALMLAVLMEKDVRVVRALLAKPEIDINAKTSGEDEPVLILAVTYEKKVPIVEELLKRKDIDVKVKNEVGARKWLGSFEVLDGHGTHDWCVAGWRHCAEYCHTSRFGRDAECAVASP